MVSDSASDVRSAAPYINNLANTGVLFTDSHGITHPSQPNYLELFSGSTQGITNDTIATSTPFTTPNLGASLIAAGKTFAGYSETQPSAGYLGTFTDTAGTDHRYSRKHNPWSNWQGTSTNQLPASTNQTFGAFQSITDYATLPTVSFVVPNQLDDEHDLSPFSTPLNTLIGTSDSWLQNNVSAYANWAKTHNSLLIVTWDEGFFDASLTPPDYSPGNHIATVFYGANVGTGTVGATINHDNILRTIEDLEGVAPIGNAVTARSFANVVPEPASIALVVTERVNDYETPGRLI